VPLDTHIHLPGCFAPGWIYELVYTGRIRWFSPRHIAVRDFVASSKYGEEMRRTANPLREQGGVIEKAYAWGRSQTAVHSRLRPSRFNADEQERRVFDGMLPHVSAADDVDEPPLRNLVSRRTGNTRSI